MQYLVFQLYGPMCAWGENAIGEIRKSENRPTKSALIGLVGAALGIRRDQTFEQNNLARAYEFGIKLFSAGSILHDYHTTQTANSLKYRDYHSRREIFMNNREEIHTILSKREYRCDAFSIIAMRAKAEVFYSLSSIKEALLKPKFHLYLGRKSCPLAIPLSPAIMEGSGYKEILDQYSLPPALKYLYRYYKYDKENLSGYFWEGETPDLKPEFTVIRQDQPLNRNRWQFVPRQEHQSNFNFNKEYYEPTKNNFKKQRPKQDEVMQGYQEYQKTNFKEK